MRFALSPPPPAGVVYLSTINGHHAFAIDAGLGLSKGWPGLVFDGFSTQFVCGSAMASWKGLAVLSLLLFSSLFASARSVGGRPSDLIRSDRRTLRQDAVTFDEHSLFINGERLFLYSGEFHPFRLPVPGLWLDIFQKIRALGYNGVSFYVDWAVLEGTQGVFRAEGVFALEPFFAAAQEAGIFLLAVSCPTFQRAQADDDDCLHRSQRPGPYINAEVNQPICSMRIA